MVTRGEDRCGRGRQAYEERRRDRTVTDLGRKAGQLGYELVRPPGNPAEQNAAVPADWRCFTQKKE